MYLENMNGLSASEQKMFFEISSVMKKYEDVRSFNLALDHNHFDIKKGEVLHEVNDPDARTLSLSVVNSDELPKTSKPTQWSIDENSIEVKTWCCD